VQKSNVASNYRLTIGAEETASMLGISKQTLYNYLSTGNPRAPRPIEVYGDGVKRNKLTWLLRDVITHVEAMSSGVTYIGTVKSPDGWIPTVTFHGKRWDGQCSVSIFQAFEAASRYYEQSRSR